MDLEKHMVVDRHSLQEAYIKDITKVLSAAKKEKALGPMVKLVDRFLLADMKNEYDLTRDEKRFIKKSSTDALNKMLGLHLIATGGPSMKIQGRFVILEVEVVYPLTLNIHFTNLSNALYAAMHQAVA